MEEPNSNGKSRNLTYILIFILFLIVIILLGGGLYIGHSRINKLSRELNQTQKQVENAKNEASKTKEDTVQSAMNGTKNTADAIKDIDNPIIRLALTKAYAQALRPNLSKANQADLDAVLLYVNRNPKILVTKNSPLPKEIALAVSDLKTAAKNLRIAGVATMQKVDNVTYAQGELISLNGFISYVENDKDLSGSVFTLTESKTGYVYYLEFNEANSQLILDTMDGKEVSVTIKVTSKSTEPLTFQVVKGPTLVAGTTTPTQKAMQETPNP